MAPLWSGLPRNKKGPFFFFTGVRKSPEESVGSRCRRPLSNHRTKAALACQEMAMGGCLQGWRNLGLGLLRTLTALQRTSADPTQML